MENINIILFDNDELTRTVIESYLKETTFVYKLYKYDKFDEKLIPDNGFINFIFVNIGLSNAEDLNTISKLSSKQENLFVVISNDTSTDIHVKSLRAGAKEFISSPPVKSEFLKVVNSFYNKEVQNKAGENMTKVYTIISPESGIGKTFFLVNVAKEVADVTKEKVLIVDFNNNINDISIMLDINSKYNTSFILGNITESTAQSYMENIQKYKNSSLYIMANGMYTNSVHIQENKLKLFLSEAKKTYKYIFFDLDPELTPINELVLKSSDYIYCLLDTKLNYAEKIKNEFLSKNLYGKVKFIINKYRQRDIDRIKEIETVLEKQAYKKIPQSAMSASVSMQNGKTLKEINPDIDIVKIFESIAQDIVNKD